MKKKLKNFAVVLCGCGNKDGSEIHETTFALLAIDELGHKYQCFGLNETSKRNINFLTDQPEPEKKIQIKESARIARGKIEDLENLKVENFEGLIIPGGFGVAYNLCNFAEQQANAIVHKTIARIIREFHSSNKPIGVICIAPVLVALVLGKEFNPLVTAGKQKDPVAQVYEELGCRTVACKPENHLVDKENKIVSTSAYMNATRISEVKQGIEKLVQEVDQLSSDSKTSGFQADEKIRI